MIRVATENDLIRTSEIHVYGWRTAYTGLMPEEYLYNDMNVLKSQEKQMSLLNSDKGSFHLYDDGIIRGIILHGNSRDIEDNDLYEIYAIYIEPQFKKRGYGKKLLKYVESEALKKGKKTLIIWTLEENKTAQRFYENNDYRLDGNQKYIEQWNLKEIRYSKRLEG